MPINYQQIQAQSASYCERSMTHQQALQQASSALMGALQLHGLHTDVIGQLIETEARSNKMLRCACPLLEQPVSVHHLPETPGALMLIAADGSQINPSRHRQVGFGLINVATISIQTNADEAPVVETDSILLDEFAQDDGKPILTEDLIALERDIRERAALLARARKITSPLITLTDGPLELFREISETAWFRDKLDEYIRILEACQQNSIITAGYVDKPHSDLVTRMLRLAIDKLPNPVPLPLAGLENIRVPDVSLFSELLSNPGDRSAIYRIQSQWTKHFKNGLQLCFFYLNIGRPGKPCLARVELPAWVAENEPWLNELHVAIYRQCEIMGTRPYPYILHRAHELAVVTYEETAQLEYMLVMELQARGVDVGVKSNKQSAKDLPGRGRHP